MYLLQAPWRPILAHPRCSAAASQHHSQTGFDSKISDPVRLNEYRFPRRSEKYFGACAAAGLNLFTGGLAESCSCLVPETTALFGNSLRHLPQAATCIRHLCPSAWHRPHVVCAFSGTFILSIARTARIDNAASVD